MPTCKRAADRSAVTVGAAVITEPGPAAAVIAKPPPEQQALQQVASPLSAPQQQHSALKRQSPSTALSRLAKLVRLSPVVRQPQPGSSSPLVSLHPFHQDATASPKELQGCDDCLDPLMKVNACQPDSSVADPPAVAADEKSGRDNLDDGSISKQPTPCESKLSQGKGSDAECDMLGASKAKDDGGTIGIASHCQSYMHALCYANACARFHLLS